MAKTCNKCGIEIKNPGVRQRVCSQCKHGRSNKARTDTRAMHDLNFIGVDGEGVDRPDGKQDYVMLSVGNETLVNDDGSELTTDQIFTFLWKQYQVNHKNDESAVFIGFFLSYDFTQWTKHLPKDVAWKLWSKAGQLLRKPKTRKNPDPFPVYWGEWEFDVLTKRRFRLRKHKHRSTRTNSTLCRCGKTIDDPSETPDINIDIDNVVMGEILSDKDLSNLWKALKSKPKDDGWMYICDTASFWQMSFKKVLSGKWPSGFFTEDDFKVINAGKDNRGMEIIEYGDTSTYEEMGIYNRRENELLAKVTAYLNKGFIDIGLRIAGRNWYGPGQAAQLWLDSQTKDMPEGETFKREDIERCVPQFARDAGRNSYYGGWFEIFYHGRIESTIYNYDINSAYPTVIASLPCLIHGRWSEGTTLATARMLPSNSLICFDATVHGSNPYMGAMPHRTNTGRILRPHHTRGWYWLHELDAAMRAGLIDTWEVHSYVAYEPCNCPPPLAGIRDLYQARITKVNGESIKETPKGKAYKLVYNSAYGKFAQSIGAPKFANSIYASLITAGCRTTILNAIADHPGGAEAVTMVATDGVYFTSEWPGVEKSEILGGWDKTIMHNVTQFMPGLYWCAGEQDWKAKTRGVNVNDLSKNIEALNEAFIRFRIAVANGDAYEWPSLEIPITFDFTNATQAIARGVWSTAGYVDRDNPTRTINSIPENKRVASYPYADALGVRTSPFSISTSLESTPYDKRFGEQLAEEQEANQRVTRDGYIDAEFKWIMGLE